MASTKACIFFLALAIGMGVICVDGQKEPIKIGIHWVSISNANDDRGSVTGSQLEEQLKILNTAFANHFAFHINTIRRIKDDAKYQNCPRMPGTFLREYHQGDARDLNILTCEFQNDDFYGSALAPTIYYEMHVSKCPPRDAADGVLLNVKTLPGNHNSTTGHGAGKMLVHEVGHFLGLYHTWGKDQSGKPYEGLPYDRCDLPEADDGIEDTPKQKAWAIASKSGCIVNYCDSPTVDRLATNFMDYSRYDDCMTEFTAGQFERMEDEWRRWRECGNGQCRDDSHVFKDDCKGHDNHYDDDYDEDDDDYDDKRRRTARGLRTVRK